MTRMAQLAALAAACAAAGAGVASAADPLQPQEWFLAAVGADRATAPGPGVPLTIVDSGLDAAQPDFAGRPATAYLNAQTTTGPNENHGTEIASVAAAPANGTGIAGIYPQAALDVWDATPAPTGIQSQPAAAGIAAAPCPGVVNLSWGTTTIDPVVDQAIQAAERRGCLVVAAAGNLGDKGNPKVYPAADLHVLAVGSSDQSGAPAAFSSTGPWVDLLAPGVGIEVDTPLWRDPSGNVLADGTSFSAAIVSAAAAWVWTERPTLTAAQLFQLLRGSVVNGVLDIPTALAAPTPPNDPQEPNDTVAEAATQPTLKSRIAASLDATKDPRDLYRIVVRGRVRLTVTHGAVARIVARKGRIAYAEVTLARGVATARYVLRVTTG